MSDNGSLLSGPPGCTPSNRRKLIGAIGVASRLVSGCLLQPPHRAQARRDSRHIAAADVGSNLLPPAD
jgi:hypothetical protein